MPSPRPRFRHRSFRDQRHAVVIFVLINVLVGVALVSAAVYAIAG
jgi:hypothetical protein